MDSLPQTRKPPQSLLPLPWDQWPAEARLTVGRVMIWSLLGLLVLTSASWWVGDREMGDAAYYIKRQGLWLVASWALFWLAIRTSLRRWLHLAPTALLIGTVLVAATLVVGSTVNGASRWLVIGPIQI
ncbi:MAG: FtsW/RodA/SpoVE family cell cycle protein, partial [Cyanobacteriota bacterium]